MWVFAGMQMAIVDKAFVIDSVYRDKFAHCNKLNCVAPGKAHLYY